MNNFLNTLQRRTRATIKNGRLATGLGLLGAVLLASAGISVWLSVPGVCLVVLFALLEVYRQIRQPGLTQSDHNQRYKTLAAIVIAEIPLYATMHHNGAVLALPATGLFFLAMRMVPAVRRVQMPIQMANVKTGISKAEPKYLDVVILATVAAVAILGVLGLHAGFALALALLVTAGLWFYSRRVYARSATGVLDKVRPRFIIPYTAKSGFHIPLWEPYLKKLSLPYLIIVVHQQTFETVADMTDAPVILLPEISAAGAKRVTPKSVKAAFYMCNNDENKYFLANKAVTSIWLHHGDSDKHVCAVGKSAQYDHLFVAGQAAIDRYAENDIHIPSEKFTIIGRPQVSDIEFAPRRDRKKRPVVAYAPTWQKHTDIPEHRYSSLVPMGLDIVKALVAEDAVVIFRPHPLSKSKVRKKQRDAVRAIQQYLQADKNTTGREHVWGKQAETVWSVADVSNHSDALVSDVSSVVTDYMQSGKPIAMASPYSPTDDYREQFPSAQGAYVMEASEGSIKHALNAMLEDDPLADLRLRRRKYYLGGFEGKDAIHTLVSNAQQILTDNA